MIRATLCKYRVQVSLSVCFPCCRSTVIQNSKNLPVYKSKNPYLSNILNIYKYTLNGSLDRHSHLGNFLLQYLFCKFLAHCVVTVACCTCFFPASLPISIAVKYSLEFSRQKYSWIFFQQKVPAKSNSYFFLLSFFFFF